MVVEPHGKESVAAAEAHAAGKGLVRKEHLLVAGEGVHVADVGLQALHRDCQGRRAGDVAPVPPLLPESAAEGAHGIAVTEQLHAAVRQVASVVVGTLVDLRRPDVAAVSGDGHEPVAAPMRKRGVVSVDVRPLGRGFGRDAGRAEAPRIGILPRSQPQVGGRQLRVDRLTAVGRSGHGKARIVPRHQRAASVGMAAREGQRERPQIAVEAHREQRLLQHVVALGTYGEARLREQPHGIHRAAAETVDGVGRVVVAVMEDRAVALEAGRRSLGHLVTVVHPAGEGLQIGRLRGRVGQHQDARQSADERRVEGVDIHAGHLGREFHLAHAREPLHGLLHVVLQSGAAQHVAHDDRRRIEVAHAVAEVVQRTLCTAGGEALVEQVARQQHIHPCQLLAFGRPLRGSIPGHGQLEEEVVAAAQRLAVRVVEFGNLRVSEVDIGLGIAHEPHGRAVQRAVGILRDAVCGELLPQALQRQRLAPLEQQLAQARLDGGHIAPFVVTDRRRGLGHRVAPRLQQHEPVHRRRGIDERSLKIGRMVPHVLERGEDPVVEEEFSGRSPLDGHGHLVHPLLGCSLHVAVEGDPGAAPAGEAQPVVEPRAGASLLAELEAERPLQRLRGIDPEDERGDGGFARIGVLGEVLHRRGDAHLRTRLRPLPAHGAAAVLVVVARKAQCRARRRLHRRRRLLERENPVVGDLLHGLGRRAGKPHRRYDKKEQSTHCRYGLTGFSGAARRAKRAVRPCRHAPCGSVPRGSSSRRSSAARQCCCRAGCCPRSASAGSRRSHPPERGRRATRATR